MTTHPNRQHARRLRQVLSEMGSLTLAKATKLETITKRANNSTSGPDSAYLSELEAETRKVLRDKESARQQSNFSSESLGEIVGCLICFTKPKPKPEPEQKPEPRSKLSIVQQNVR